MSGFWTKVLEMAILAAVVVGFGWALVAVGGH